MDSLSWKFSLFGLREITTAMTAFVISLTLGSITTESARGAEAPARTVIYETGFEIAEGYDPKFELIGQQNWQGEGTGGNGLILEAIPGMGQQAYVGFFPPLQKEEFLNVWRPVNYQPVPADVWVVRFSVAMQIFASTNGAADDFRWSAYNAEAKRFLSIDFEGQSRRISIVTDDGQFHPTEFQFEYEGFYELDIWMNFAHNVWTAVMNDVVIANSIPLTTTGLKMTLGDVDAVWAIRDPQKPGDNFMVFDDYQIVAEPYGSIPPRLEMLGVLENGAPLLRLYGEVGLKYAIDVTANWTEWETLGTFPTQPDGTFEFEDTTAPGFSAGFYAARQVR